LRRAGLAFLFLLVLLICAFGVLYLQSVKGAARKVAADHLAAVAHLKVREIVNWRGERLSDGNVLTKNPYLPQAVARWLADPEATNAEPLLIQFRSWQTHYRYSDVLLVDADGKVRLSLGGRRDRVHETTVPVLAAALRDRRVMLTDLHVGPDNLPPRINVVVPLSEANAVATAPRSAIILQTDAGDFLFPLIQAWPTPSPSAETLLIRREGDNVLYLNELRHRKGTALTLRLPLGDRHLPAARATRGENGTMTGEDYRNVPVLAHALAVPGTKWFMVAKVDLAEINAPLRPQVASVSAIIGLLLLVAGLGAGVMMRQQHVAFFRQKAEWVRESELRYRRLFEAARDGVLILDAETGQVVDVNPFMLELLGVTREVFLGKKVWELGFFKDLVANEAKFAELKAKQYIRYEDMALEGHDGKRHEVEFVSNVYLVDGKKVIQCNIRDITARMLAEADLVETKALLQASLDHSQAGIAIADAPSGKLRYVNKAGLLIGGGTEAELVGGLDVNQYVASWNLFDLDGTPLAQEEVPLARAVLFGEQCAREFIIRRSELDDRIVLANATPIRNLAGEVTAGVVVFLDITERKRVEKQLLQNAQELRARNEELTRFNRLMAGRELHVIELKQQVNDLAAQLGQSRPYPLAFLDATAAEVVRTTAGTDEQRAEVSKTQKEKSP
jgi:PAS domain S-box-containing protein